MPSYYPVQLAPTMILGEAGPLPPLLQGSLSDEALADLSWTDESLGLRGTGYWPVVIIGPAEMDPLSQHAVDGAPVLHAESRAVVVQQSAAPLPPEMLAANEAAIVKSVTDAVQAHMDAAARERGYDGILSACTYAGSSVEKFRAEGAAAVAWRDAVWTHCYAELARIKASERPVPTAAALVAELPPLEW